MDGQRPWKASRLYASVGGRRWPRSLARGAAATFTAAALVLGCGACSTTSAPSAGKVTTLGAVPGVSPAALAANAAAWWSAVEDGPRGDPAGAGRLLVPTPDVDGASAGVADLSSAYAQGTFTRADMNAFGENRLVLDATAVTTNPPPGASGAVRWADGVTRQLPLLSVQQGLVQWAATLPPLVAAFHPGRARAVLHVTTASATTMDLATSNGAAQVPAWRLDLAGTTTTITVLAAQAAAALGAPEPPLPDLTARVFGADAAHAGSDGRHLTFELSGPAGPASQVCGADFTAHAASADRAVAIDITERLNLPGGPHTGCAASATARYVHVLLPQPLGARTLIDATTLTPIALD